VKIFLRISFFLTRFYYWLWTQFDYKALYIKLIKSKSYTQNQLLFYFILVINTSSFNLFMESYSFDLCITPMHSVLPQPSLNGYFSIHLHYKHLTISHPSNDPTNPIFNSQTPIFDYFLIPHDILCNYNIHPVIDGYDHITHFLYDTFNHVPNVITDNVLCQMADCGRRMIAREVKCWRWRCWFELPPHSR
jgi:hypothetical protein